ncbi:hypothetical protein C0Q70_19720 [Pomacea canaliculata]|uniref:Uncharacterized protein n=1 Tax=Pomacea canaliculata TaxID=400727 RepID=A0A2T7NDI1_POMCA|nr:hypothetical protein C0Q70_19720 [Pomacea canaliculata]
MYIPCLFVVQAPVGTAPRIYMYTPVACTPLLQITNLSTASHDVCARQDIYRLLVTSMTGFTGIFSKHFALETWRQSAPFPFSPLPPLLVGKDWGLMLNLALAVSRCRLFTSFERRSSHATTAATIPLLQPLATSTSLKAQRDIRRKPFFHIWASLTTAGELHMQVNGIPQKLANTRALPCVAHNACRVSEGCIKGFHSSVQRRFYQNEILSTLQGLKPVDQLKHGKMSVRGVTTFNDLVLSRTGREGETEMQSDAWADDIMVDTWNGVPRGECPPPCEWLICRPSPAGVESLTATVITNLPPSPSPHHHVNNDGRLK